MNKQYYQTPLVSVMYMTTANQLLAGSLLIGGDTSNSSGDAPARRFSPTPGLGTN